MTSTAPELGRTASTADLGVPFLSVVIAVWNRQDTLRRCLDSILAQDFDDWEVIAVDDGSTDESVKVLESYSDPRVKVLRHTSNVGHWAARGTGIKQSRSPWVLKFDSDDELLPGALRRIAEMARAANDEIGIVGMSYLFEDGSVGPDPPFPQGPVRLPGYLRWQGNARRIDFMTCFRKDLFDAVPLPPADGRGGTQMMLRIAARSSICVDAAAGGLVHTDAPNRRTGNSHTPFSRRRTIANATEAREILREFGREMRCQSPRWRKDLMFESARWYFQAGERTLGAISMGRYLVRWPMSVSGWLTMFRGLVGRLAVSTGPDS